MLLFSIFIWLRQINRRTNERTNFYFFRGKHQLLELRDLSIMAVLKIHDAISHPRTSTLFSVCMLCVVCVIWIERYFAELSIYLMKLSIFKIGNVHWLECYFKICGKLNIPLCHMSMTLLSNGRNRNVEMRQFFHVHLSQKLISNFSLFYYTLFFYDDFTNKIATTMKQNKTKNQQRKSIRRTRTNFSMGTQYAREENESTTAHMSKIRPPLKIYWRWTISNEINLFIALSLYS